MCRPLLTLLGATTLALTALNTPAIAQNSDHPASSTTQPLQYNDAVAETLDSTKAKLAFGFLSDPNEPPKDFLESLLTGKVHLNNRLRFEFADTTARDSSIAITNRLRLGYSTKPFHGFSAFIEMENVSTPDVNGYFVPATGDGDASKTVIAEPPGTEVNQAFARYKVTSLFDSNVAFDMKAGRQRIKLDDDRFIGNVGWRQFEQTYDSVRITTDLGIKNLSVNYAYIWQVLRIFGPDGPSWNSDSHIINVSYAFAPELKVTPFAYLLDFKRDSPINSSNTYGVRLTGTLDRDTEDDDDIYYAYELTYANQTDAGSNPVDFEVHFFAAEGRVTKNGLGSVIVGYMFLGSDDGKYGFRFPLATNHKFQGFADVFVVTPATGVQDLYITGAADLVYGIKGSATFHQFWADEGNTDLGYEIDLVASKKITSNWAVLAKAAFFQGNNGMPDTTRVWLQTTLSF